MNVMMSDYKERHREREREREIVTKARKRLCIEYYIYIVYTLVSLYIHHQQLLDVFLLDHLHPTNLSKPLYIIENFNFSL